MRRIGYRVSLTLVALLMSVAAFGQSEPLGDIARENREKRAAQESSSTPPTVITNKNLRRDSGAGASDDTPAPHAPTPKPNSPFSEKMATQGSTNERSSKGPAPDRST